jgi:hypothetical protein
MSVIGGVVGQRYSKHGRFQRLKVQQGGRGIADGKIILLFKAVMRFGFPGGVRFVLPLSPWGQW